MGQTHQPTTRDGRAGVFVGAGIRMENIRSGLDGLRVGRRLMDLLVLGQERCTRSIVTAAEGQHREKREAGSDPIHPLIWRLLRAGGDLRVFGLARVEARRNPPANSFCFSALGWKAD
jgi:hypothetical protein